MFKILLYMSVVVCLFSCSKKNGPAPIPASKDEIILSINNAAQVHYDKSTYNPATERNNKWIVDFSRTYYTTPTRLPQDFNIVDISLYDQNLFNQPLPYQVKNSYILFQLKRPITWALSAFPLHQAAERGMLE